MSISAEKYNNSNGRSNGGSRGGGGKDGRHLGEEQSTTLQRTLPEVEQEGEELLSEAYVHSLASLGLERLQNEPGRLHAEANAVDEALHSLSLDHYRVFIQNQECVRHVRIQGQQMDEHLSALLAEVHGLGSEFSVFQREAAELVGGHKRNRQTLKHHMQLVELLEVPQLMDACVRSDLLEEALSIATFASTLERRHRSRRVTGTVATTSIGAAAGGQREEVAEGRRDEGHLPGVIRMIVDEVRESARSLHDRLLAKLRGPIQLSNCLQVVSCLRRLELLALEEKESKKQKKRPQQQQQQEGREKDGEGTGLYGASSFTSTIRAQRQLALVEMKLQVDFLEARDAWLADAASRAGIAGDFHHALGGLSSSSPYQSLMDLIESSRSQWFEVATQFKAMFLSEGGSGNAAGGAGRLESSGKENGGINSSNSTSGDILSLWLLRRVTAFVEHLKTLLPLVEDGASLRSLLEECMFFGASMGRLGTDFRGLLVPVFEERVVASAAGQWASASADFVVTLRDVAAIEAAGENGSTLIHVPDKSIASASSVSASASDGTTVTTMNGGSRARGEPEASSAALFGNDGPPPPPRLLMVFPPVARLVNRLLTSFNQVRECLPVSVEARLTESLVRCFTEVFEALADLQKSAVRANAEAAASSSLGTRARGGDDNIAVASYNTTARAVELACAAFAAQAVPHISLCFAYLFGESPVSAAADMSPSPMKQSGRRERLLSRLLNAMEDFGIYEKPAPLPPPPAATAESPPSPVAVAAQSPLAPAKAPVSAVGGVVGGSIPAAPPKASAMAAAENEDSSTGTAAVASRGEGSGVGEG